MHIYAFGSICRGEISEGSDVDLLAIVDSHDSRFDPSVYSIYSYKRVQELWEEGNPFAWHLAMESRLLFGPNDFLKDLGSPNPYRNCLSDCDKFRNLFREAYDALVAGSVSPVFDLSIIFLSIRNLATCYSLGLTNRPDFSRNSAQRLGTASLLLSRDTYRVLERARLLCTRGWGADITRNGIQSTVQKLSVVSEWMDKLIQEVKKNELQ